MGGLQLFSLWTIYISLKVTAFAATLSLDCDGYLLKLDRTPTGLYFNRWNFDSQVRPTSVFQKVIDSIDPHLPILILDTNPEPNLWLPHNIVDSMATKVLGGLPYSQLTIQQRDLVMDLFASRVLEQLHLRTNRIFIFDHHFDSPVLSDTSATVLILDFIGWLQRQPESPRKQAIHSLLRDHVAIRDHSDIDIILANFSIRLAERPQELNRWSSLLKRIALFNDYGHLDSALDRKQMNQVLAAYHLLFCFEDWIATRMNGGFDWALDRIPDLLEITETLNIESDPLLDLIAHWKARNVEKAWHLDGFLQSLEKQWMDSQRLSLLIEQSLSVPGLLEISHRVLTLWIAPQFYRPFNSLDIIRYLKRFHPDLVSQSEVLIFVYSELKDQKTFHHVKLRSVNSSLRLDPIFEEVRKRQWGGGGRSGAGGLYAPTGNSNTSTQLRDDLTWLRTEIVKIQTEAL